MERLTVAIDGPAGAGKSSAARLVAKRLGYLYIDTGAMYRAFTWAMLQEHIDIEDAEAVRALTERVDIRLEPLEGTACTDISSIEEDREGNLWIGTQHGLSKLDVQTGRFTNYFTDDGIGGNQFYDRASCRLHDGTLALGGTHGLTFFDPVAATPKRDVPLLFENLKVHNRLMRPDNADACIDRHLSYRPDIHLAHDQNGFSISFAALDYNEFERVHYYYRLEGFDHYWIDARHNREAYYANLPSGTYTFRVRATGNAPDSIQAESAIRVIVRPAPWDTWWAWLLYLLAAATLAGLFIRNLRRIRAEKAAIRRAEQEKEQEQRVNRMNMSFFANISHEFRTPLTMIAGPVRQLCDAPDITGENKSLLLIVWRSVERMLRLVNQMMDFNKLENDALKLKVHPADIIGILRRMTDVFRVNAQDKGINLTATGLEDSCTLWLDEDKAEKIFTNLMGNALKFTPTGGSIRMAFDVVTREEAARLFPLTADDRDTQWAKVSVSNTGPGIPPAQREKIFERYYQVTTPDGTGQYNRGTGIGLYYARNLVRLHHGYILNTDPDEGTGKEATLNYYYEDRLLGSARAKVSDSYIEDHSAQVKDISGEKTETEKEGMGLVSVAILAAAVVLLLILILLFIRVIRKRKQRRRRRRRRRR